MADDHSIRFFDEQFRKQVSSRAFALNPFERLALGYLHGRILDYGCGLGNLSQAAAHAGCTVLSLDASPTAIAHLHQIARTQGLAIEAQQQDLRHHVLAGRFDAVVCIGLLMFFPCELARIRLDALMSAVNPGGILVLNVLTRDTTYMDMFDPDSHCLFRSSDVLATLSGWALLECQEQVFEAPGNTVKAFLTVIARRPLAPQTDSGSDQTMPRCSVA